ncbi:MAG: DUF4142 domain-containing protein [Myxococcota bacterium]|nr:DUF4142 domain-containing protein [Myxococcota bacterium]
MRTSRTMMLVPSLLAVLVAGCGGGNDQEAKAPENASASMPEASTSATAQTASDMGSTVTSNNMVDAGGTPTGATGGGETTATNTDTAPAVTLTDSQILEITHVANVGEIEQAKLAQTKGKDARVKGLAAMMIKDHRDADTKGMALGKKASLKPDASPTSSSLESDAKSMTDSLKSQTGADFDKSYVDAQVKEHQAVLDTIDQKLLPSAKNADVKAFLTEVRPKIAMHLQHAQDLQKKMAK